MSATVGHGSLLGKGDIDPHIKKQTGQQGRKKGEHVQRHSGAKHMVLPGFRVAGTEKHVQDEQESKQERQGEAESGNPKRHTNGFKLLTQTLWKALRRGMK